MGQWPFSESEKDVLIILAPQTSCPLQLWESQLSQAAWPWQRLSEPSSLYEFPLAARKYTTFWGVLPITDIECHIMEARV